PLLYVTIAFILGIIISDNKILHPFASISFLAASILVLLLLKKGVPVLVLFFTFFFAVPYCYFRVSYPPEHIKNFAKVLDYRRVELTGKIAADPDIIRSSGTANIILEAESIKLKGTQKTNTCGLVKLTLKEKIDYGDLNYGDRLSVYARFHAPSIPKNPGEFNYRKYLERKNIFLLGSADQKTGDSLEKIGEGEKNIFVSWTINMKHRLLRIIEKTTPGEAACLIQGVLLGEEDSLSLERKQQFRATGTFHILAVSGFNVALVVAAFFFILRLLKYGKKFSAAVSIVFVFIFCFVTGCSPSVVRATIICVFALTSVLLERDADIINLLALSALLMLIADPNTLFDIGFQLSYVSTLGLILLASKIEEYLKFLPAWLGGPIAVTLSAQLFVAPVTVLYFNSFSTLTLPANLCIAPFVWFSTVAGFFQAAFGVLFLPAGNAIGFINAFSVMLMFKVVEFFSGFSFSVLRFSSPGILFFSVYYISVTALIYYKNLYKEKPVLAVLLFAFLSVIVWLKVFTVNPEMEVTMIALRNAKAALVSFGAEYAALYVDGKTDAYEAERKILPLLNKKGVSSLSILIYSEEFENYVSEFRAEKTVKIRELKSKALKIKGRADSVIYAGGSVILGGSFGSQSFFIDKDKLVCGEERQTVFFKEVKKKGAFIAVSDGKTWKGRYWRD
ncbi:MAG: ComEC/Rec2 family competence protein, partial [Candidatus Firestonebacteria bacterium]